MNTFYCTVVYDQPNAPSENFKIEARERPRRRHQPHRAEALARRTV